MDGQVAGRLLSRLSLEAHVVLIESEFNEKYLREERTAESEGSLSDSL